jgi:hypothetical protein
VAVARHNQPHESAALAGILTAARIIGYPDASPSDPLIVTAVAGLNKAPRMVRK